MIEHLPPFVRYGSVLMWTALVAGGAHTLLCGLQLALAHKVDLRPLLWAVVVATTLLGATVLTMEVVRANEALAMLAVPAKQAILARGMWLSAYDRVVVLAVLGGQVVSAAVTHCLFPMVRRLR